MGDLQRVDMHPWATGYPRRDLPDTMAPEMMRLLLGGKFPDTGFGWDSVEYFKLEEGVWEPYGGFDEILPGAGFKISVETVNI